MVAVDVITAVDGKDSASPRELALSIAGIVPGKTVDVTVWRNGKSEVIKVDLGTLPGSDKQRPCRTMRLPPSSLRRWPTSA